MGHVSHTHGSTACSYVMAVAALETKVHVEKGSNMAQLSVMGRANVGRALNTLWLETIRSPRAENS